MKVLIMGLPNSGKTFLAKKIAEILKVPNINADALRQMCNDWEFSEAGRVRQSERMAMIANYENQRNDYVICDFVCPTRKTKEIFKADFVIWMDTSRPCKYPDTIKIFENPKKFDYRVTAFDDADVEKIIIKLLEQKNDRK